MADILQITQSAKEISQNSPDRALNFWIDETRKLVAEGGGSRAHAYFLDLMRFIKEQQNGEISPAIKELAGKINSEVLDARAAIWERNIGIASTIFSSPFLPKPTSRYQKAISAIEESGIRSDQELLERLCSVFIEDPLISRLRDQLIVPVEYPTSSFPLASVLINEQSSETTPTRWSVDTSMSASLARDVLQPSPSEVSRLSRQSTGEFDLRTGCAILSRALQESVAGFSSGALFKALHLAGADKLSFRLMNVGCERANRRSMSHELSNADVPATLLGKLQDSLAYITSGAWHFGGIEIRTASRSNGAADILPALKTVFGPGVTQYFFAEHPGEVDFRPEQRLYFGAELVRVVRSEEKGLAMPDYDPNRQFASGNNQSAETQGLADLWSNPRGPTMISFR